MSVDVRARRSPWRPARKDPTRLRVIVRSSDAMALILGIRVVRFRANNAGVMRARCRDRYIRAADVAEIVVAANNVAAAARLLTAARDASARRAPIVVCRHRLRPTANGPDCAARLLIYSLLT
jgi:hypothetical protein